MKYKVLKNIFTDNECISFINKYEKYLDEEYELANGQYSRYDFRDNQLANDIFIKLKPFLENNIVQVNNKFYISKYHPNSCFICEHADGNVSNNNLISKYTFIIYVNDNFDEGETVFVKDNIAVKPVGGNVLILSQYIIHKAVPPKNGYKYIL